MTCFLIPPKDASLNKPTVTQTNSMLSQTFKSIGNHAFGIKVYESVEEGDAAAGRAGAILTEANLNLVYRGTLADARDLFIELIEKETGIKRLEKDTGEKDKDGLPIMEVSEKDGDFYRRVLREKNLLETETPFRHLADQVTNWVWVDDKEQPTGEVGLSVDIKKKVRTGPKITKLAQKYLDAANGIIAKGDAQVEKWAAKFSSDLGRTITTDALMDATILGRTIKEHVAWKEAKALAEMSTDIV